MENSLRSIVNLYWMCVQSYDLFYVYILSTQVLFMELEGLYGQKSKCRFSLSHLFFQSQDKFSNSIS